METPRAVQQVTKASSDKLLRKFADTDSDTETPSSARKSSSKRRRSIEKSEKKRKTRCNNNIIIDGEENNLEMCMMSPSKEQSCSSNNASLRVVERKSLLPQHYRTTRRSSSSGSFLVKHLGISRSHHFRGVRDSRTKYVLSAIEKTWSKAVRGASKVFMEKHYNRHRSLIDDIV